MFEPVFLNLVRPRIFPVCHFIALVLNVFIGDSLCLLGWNVDVCLLCPLNCVVDFWCSPYVVPESIGLCFVFAWDFCFFLVVSEVEVYSSSVCVKHSIYLVSFCSGSVPLKSVRYSCQAVNLCFASSVADLRHPFLLYCFTITVCILDFLS